MNRITLLLSAFVLGGAATLSAGVQDEFRQTYPLDAERVRENARKVAKDLETLPGEWKNAKALYYVVPPMSDIPRMPDCYPDDGIAAGTLNLIAAKGEYEPASLLFYPRENVDRFLLKASDLKNAKGQTIPASAVDLKLIKIWYQSGAAWYGYFADALGRRLCPELLVNDENLVRVDPSTKDNYVRYSNEDGSQSWQWMSADFSTVNYSFDNQAQQGLIADAKTLQPAVLNKDEFKQFFVTVHVPENVAEGLYSGEIEMIADGRKIASVPLRLRVLPFALPQPKTNYNQDKGFYLCFYGTGTRNPAILQNLAAHNALNPMGFPKINVFDPDEFRKDIELANKYDLNTRPIFSGSAGVGVRTQNPPTEADKRTLAVLQDTIAKTAELTKKELGHTDFYSYGVDEGGPATIRLERNAWEIAHKAGGKVMVTSYAWRELLFALDFLIIPGVPTEQRIKEVDLFHASNPDALTGWYANPHTGPENPNYFRRIHGMMAYKGNYDVSSNYCWWRNNWNDMATPYENNLRNLVTVYGTRDGVLDTLAWEGIREGLDDIRYSTLVKDLALKASRSSNGEVQLLGRRVLSFLTYWDAGHADLDAYRLECIRYILQLSNALKGDK